MAMVSRIGRTVTLGVAAAWLFGAGVLVRASEDAPGPERPSSPLRALILSSSRPAIKALGGSRARRVFIPNFVIELPCVPVPIVSSLRAPLQRPFLASSAAVSRAKCLA